MNEHEKKKYQEAMDALSPSDESLRALLAAAEQADRSRDPSPAPSLPRRVSGAFYKRRGLVLTAAVLALAFCLPLFLPGVRTVTPADTPLVAESYQELYNTLSALYEDAKDEMLFLKGDDVTSLGGAVLSVPDDPVQWDESATIPSVQMNGTADEHSDPDRGEETAHSTTNEQVAGVQEADIVKTDGEYLYLLGGAINQSLRIVHVDEQGAATLTARLSVADVFDHGFSATELFLCEDTLTLLGTSSLSQRCAVALLDVSDRSQIKTREVYYLDGNYRTARITDGYLYLASTVFLPGDELDPACPETFVPTYTTCEKTAPVACEDIVLVDSVTPRAGFSYLMLAGIDITNEARLVSTKCALGELRELYANTEYLFAAMSEDWSDGKTLLCSFSLTEGSLSLLGQGEVFGSAINQFALNCRGEVFSIATTFENESGDSESGVFCFTPSLSALGSITSLGIGERIYSVRYVDTRVFLVTYRQTDPLYCIELSDPTAPVLLDELKIPGYSSYLHPWKDGLLFGIGRADDNEDGSTEGAKFSLYSVGQEGALEELQTIYLGEGEENRVCYSPAEHDHKALLVSEEENLIAFCVFLGGTKDRLRVYVLREENGRMVETYLEGFCGRDTTYAANLVRLHYLGETFCVCSPEGVFTFDLDTLEPLDTLLF